MSTLINRSIRSVVHRFATSPKNAACAWASSNWGHSMLRVAARYSSNAPKPTHFDFANASAYNDAGSNIGLEADDYEGSDSDDESGDGPRRPRVKAPIYDPEHGVLPEDHEVDPSEVYVPYATEQMKQEIYQKFKTNPVDEMFWKLAQEYRMTVTRCKAIVYLMRTRENFMKRLRVEEITEQWQQIYEKYTAAENRAKEIVALKRQIAEEATYSNRRKKQLLKRRAKRSPDGSTSAAGDSLASVAADSERATAGDASDGGEGDDVDPQERLAELEAFAQCNFDTLSAEYALPVEEVKDIVSRLSEHTIRSTNLKRSIEDTEETMLELRRSGVDTAFRETASDHDHKFDHNYFPRVFGDDALEAERERLRNKLAVATRAKYEPQVKDLMGKQRDDTSTTNSKIVDNRAGVPTNTFMRAKFAFLDTSSEYSKDGATRIRTRDGR
jgi:hypothetical protein